MPLLIYHDELYMLHPLISALILETYRIIELKWSNLRSVHPAFHCFPAVIHLVRLSQKGKGYLGFSTSEVLRL